MKVVEKLFNSQNFDRKNITNKSNLVIDQNILDLIESEGATYELLEQLNVPVYKYMTQITIHGMFPELKHNYIGGYKNLFQNKNKSIGVKYGAIDGQKKRKIYNTVKSYANWSICHNSSEYFIYKRSPFIKSKDEYNTYLHDLRTLISNINNSLFFGNTGVYLSKTIYGSSFLVAFINIGAISEKNVISVIENICNASIFDIESKINTDKLQREKEIAEMNEKHEKERVLLSEKAKPIIENFREILVNAGYEKIQKSPIYDNMVVVTFEVNSEQILRVKYRKFVKSAKQKKFRYYITYSTNELVNPDFRESFGANNVYSLTTVSGWVLNHKPDNKIVSNIKIVHYSEKAIAVIGDTKAIKDILKNYGGRFNYHLTCGPGWIFPINKMKDIETLINN